MNSFYYYFNYLLPFYNESEHKINEEIISSEPLPKKFIITSEDLIKVNLIPQKNIIPAPSRNMPVLDTFELNIHNKAQLDEILNIKLKPTKINIKQTYYPPRHPVIKQLNEMFGIGNFNT